jgi:hypothetical protein
MAVGSPGLQRSIETDPEATPQIVSLGLILYPQPGMLSLGLSLMSILLLLERLFGWQMYC